jgi:hypothetical protein
MGGVGINTNNPQASLDVYGNVIVSAGIQANSISLTGSISANNANIANQIDTNILNVSGHVMSS